MSSASGFLYLREETRTILSKNQCYERSFFCASWNSQAAQKPSIEKGFSIECSGKKTQEFRKLLKRQVVQ